MVGNRPATRHGRDNTTDTPTHRNTPRRSVTCANGPETRDSDADKEYDDDNAADDNWELMQDEGRWPSWL
jgi:hypothetical protein